ncbi:hypothetical protein CkaCkLH20_12620 [Colletotrichum karsti]|uniref:Uncharacterized protein n=1 Tax=Colletotrichum karsti TaxID=1095194 RepID=A0A9P6HSV5_9PEZI|nr:uncharacterized protein CkaCkLH20_12620 [Colletotrichum karsti]KAF9869913.1 hypothetical protein CkaCkLH20_12620 [Colletotrichum karsti]
MEARMREIESVNAIRLVEDPYMSKYVRAWLRDDWDASRPCNRTEKSARKLLLMPNPGDGDDDGNDGGGNNHQGGSEDDNGDDDRDDGNDRENRDGGHDHGPQPELDLVAAAEAKSRIETCGSELQAVRDLIIHLTCSVLAAKYGSDQESPWVQDSILEMLGNFDDALEAFGVVERRLEDAYRARCLGDDHSDWVYPLKDRMQRNPQLVVNDARRWVIGRLTMVDYRRYGDGDDNTSSHPSNVITLQEPIDLTPRSASPPPPSPPPAAAPQPFSWILLYYINLAVLVASLCHYPFVLVSRDGVPVWRPGLAMTTIVAREPRFIQYVASYEFALDNYLAVVSSLAVPVTPTPPSDSSTPTPSWFPPSVLDNLRREMHAPPPAPPSGGGSSRQRPSLAPGMLLGAVSDFEEDHVKSAEPITRLLEHLNAAKHVEQQIILPFLARISILLGTSDAIAGHIRGQTNVTPTVDYLFLPAAQRPSRTTRLYRHLLRARAELHALRSTISRPLWCLFAIIIVLSVVFLVYTVDAWIRSFARATFSGTAIFKNAWNSTLLVNRRGSSSMPETPVELDVLFHASNDAHELPTIDGVVFGCSNAAVASMASSLADCAVAQSVISDMTDAITAFFDRLDWADRHLERFAASAEAMLSDAAGMSITQAQSGICAQVDVLTKYQKLVGARYGGVAGVDHDATGNVAAREGQDVEINKLAAAFERAEDMARLGCLGVMAHARMFEEQCLAVVVSAAQEYRGFMACVYRANITTNISATVSANANTNTLDANMIKYTMNMGSRTREAAQYLSISKARRGRHKYQPRPTR